MNGSDDFAMSTQDRSIACRSEPQFGSAGIDYIYQVHNDDTLQILIVRSLYHFSLLSGVHRIVRRYPNPGQQHPTVHCVTAVELTTRHVQRR